MKKLKFAATLIAIGLLSACGQKDETSAAAAPAESGPAAGAETASPAAESAAANPAAGIDTQRIANARSEPANWLTVGGGYADQRYSPLKKINADNVKDLGLAWHYKIDVDRGAEATPVVIDGTMYTTGAYSILYALNAVTGELLWKHDPEVPRNKAGYACCDVVNRGVAVYKGKVYLGTFDGRLVALDAADGSKVWEINTVDNPKRTYSITGAPIAINDMIIIGNGGAEFNARGYVSAFDAANGELKWRFYTVPGEPENDGAHKEAMDAARKTWDSTSYLTQGGGGTVWNSFSYDPELDLLYFGTGNGVSWNKLVRQEPDADNLYISSVLALKASTGEYAWHYQEVPGDNWDYDAAATMTLADLEIGGKQRKVLMHAPKNGFFYVLDRATGELLSAEKFMPVDWATHVDLETGRPVVDEKIADWTKEPKLINPGPFGSHNWQPMSFSPDTGLVYIPAQEAAGYYAPHAEPTFNDRAGLWNLGANFPLPEDPKVLRDAVKGVTSKLLAWDPVAQKEAWSVHRESIWHGGTFTTAGNLVFQGSSQGQFEAYSADKGEKLWSAPANTGVIAGASSYEVDGEQYVAIMAGWGGVFPLFTGNIANFAKVKPEARVLVFKLGGKAKLPEPKNEPNPLPELQKVEGTEAQIALGKQVYSDNCEFCHGINVVGGGLVPDLRYAKPQTHKEFAAIVAGARSDKGMPAYAGVFTAEEVEAIRQYVIQRSHDLKAELDKKEVASSKY